ncbi:hypothetical protein EVAR_7750_1 [Eumeta japonica]|uniref:Uncharacterized protein n=1 Tax=Eumeta variegata TaxID=151549 RepID=A0A4C1TM55_EUMVA|nr:hypothetical protein EVAR_7750_1 [Eumeta japonica]
MGNVTMTSRPSPSPLAGFRQNAEGRCTGPRFGSRIPNITIARDTANLLALHAPERTYRIPQEREAHLEFWRDYRRSGVSPAAYDVKPLSIEEIAVIDTMRIIEFAVPPHASHVDVTAQEYFVRPKFRANIPHPI